MKRIILPVLISLLLLSSCQKTISDFDPSAIHGTGADTTTSVTTPGGSFVATVDGKSMNFTITASTLIHSPVNSEKRMDITGTSTDGTKRIIITLGEETATGNAITVKKYILNAFPEDDPATPTIDESLTTQGFTTYGTASNGNWIYDVYTESGSFTVTSCDAATKLISGSFATTLTSLSDNTVVTITAGKLTGVKYSVLN